MINQHNNLPIGVFDSGVGGISLLAIMVKDMPNEKYIYLADSQNAPYGIRDRESVKKFSVEAAKILMQKGVKILVVACNTATSAAINDIRHQCRIPVVGMEPAIKPAVENNKNGHIIVMGTPLTLRENKFNNLCQKFNQLANISPLPCPGLVELIERRARSNEVIKYLKNRLEDIELSQISSIVLGCTHYCLIKDEIRSVVGPEIEIIDGNMGASSHVQRSLNELGLAAPEQVYPGPSDVEFITTSKNNQGVLMCRLYLNQLLQLDKETHP